MKIKVACKDKALLRFDNVKEWFISSDNIIVHIKRDNQHSIIPVSEISMLTVADEQEKI